MKKFLNLFLLFFFFRCAGFYNEPVSFETQNSSSMPFEFRLHFTGFAFYQNEIEIIKTELFKKGFAENKSSPILLEVILEEKEVLYRYRVLHFVNFLASLISGSIIPYYTLTEHRLSFRVSEKDKELSFQSKILQLDQLRGISILPLTYFYWPSKAFEKSFRDSVDFNKEKK
jgi:hypothetical protein